MSAWHGLALEELRKYAVASYRSGGGTRPDVLLLKRDGERAVLKDHNRADRWFGKWVGPLLARREARALARLHGVHGIPRLLRRVGRRALLLEYVPARPVTKVTPGDQGADFFVRFQRLVAAMHARGVAHNDLRSHGNILLGDDGDPYFVDFVACAFAGARWNPFWRWAFRRFCEADRAAIAKLKRRLAPESLTAAEHAHLDPYTGVARIARFVGHRTRDLVRLLFTRRPRSR